MRRLLLAVVMLTAMLVSVGPVGASRAAAIPGVGATVVTQGFAIKLVSVMRAHEAGLADYVAGKGNVFLFVTVRITRQGSHESYTATTQDFTIETSTGVAIDAEEFGIPHELVSKGIHRVPVTVAIGFEVPARDTHLQLLWQPSLPNNPDAQSAWLIGKAGKTIQYLQ